MANIIMEAMVILRHTPIRHNPVRHNPLYHNIH